MYPCNGNKVLKLIELRARLETQYNGCDTCNSPELITILYTAPHTTVGVIPEQRTRSSS